MTSCLPKYSVYDILDNKRFWKYNQLCNNNVISFYNIDLLK